MSYEFTQTEKDGLAALQLQVADSNSSYYGQNFRLYDYILDVITETDPNTGSESPIQGVSQSTWLWLRGAVQVNQGTGVFSEFIRAYTTAEYEIRLGTSLSTGALQGISDQIANEVTTSILSGPVPDIDDIGQIDAGQVTATLFGSSADLSPWSGCPLFLFFGESSFFNDHILDSVNGTYDAFALVRSVGDALTQLGTVTFADLATVVETITYNDNGFGLTVSAAESALDGVIDYLADSYGSLAPDFFDLATRPIILGTNLDDVSDSLSGTSGDDIVHGGKGDDTVIGETGFDVFDGGDGRDTLTYADLGASVSVTVSLLPSGTPHLQVAKSTGTDTAVDFENYILSDLQDTVTITDIETFNALGDTTFNALWSANPAYKDTLDLSGASSAVELLSTGPAKFYGFEKIIGSDHDDDIETDDPSHSDIRGGLGNDTLGGGAGADQLEGEAGDDILKGGTGADILLYTEGADTLQGEGGNDTYDLTGATESDARIVFRAGDGHDLIQGDLGDASQITFDGFDTGDITLSYDFAVDYTQSAPGGYTGYFTSGNLLITCGSSDDTIFLENMLGYYESSDSTGVIDYGYLTGGTDLIFDNRTVAVGYCVNYLGGPASVFVPTPIDAVFTSAPDDHDTEAAQEPDYSDIPGGSDGGSDPISGDGGDNTLTGSPGADRLEGGAGNDTLEGGGGADDLDGGDGIDTAIYTSSIASVTVDLSTGVGSGGDAEGDTLANIENLTGSIYGDSLTGDDGANILDGGDGIDTIIFTSTSLGIVVDLAQGSATGSEIDTDTIVNIENVIGGDGNDVISGDDLANELIGGLGADTLTGREGDDLLDGGYGSDIYVWAAGDGNDTIVDTGATSDTDELQLAAVIAVGDVAASRTGDDLVLAVSGAEQIVVKDQFVGDGVEAVSFDGGPTWDRAYFESLTDGGPSTDPWIANDDQFWTAAETSVVVDFTANDVIPSGANVNAYSWAAPQHGDLVWNGTDYTYTPDTGFTGVDWFTYGLQDGDNNDEVMTPDGAFVVVHVGQTYDPNDHTGIADNVGTGYGNYFGGSSLDDTVHFTGGDSGVSGDGKGGDDIVIFDGNISDYEIVGEGEYFTIHNTATDDSFQFTNMEYIRFNGTTAISLADIVANSNYDPGDTWYEPEPIGGLV